MTSAALPERRATWCSTRARLVEVGFARDDPRAHSRQPGAARRDRPGDLYARTSRAEPGLNVISPRKPGFDGNVTLKLARIVSGHWCPNAEHRSSSAARPRRSTSRRHRPQRLSRMALTRITALPSGTFKSCGARSTPTCQHDPFVSRAGGFVGGANRASTSTHATRRARSSSGRPTSSPPHSADPDDRSSRFRHAGL